MARRSSTQISTVDITFGVEEEFFLVNPETRDLEPDPDVRIFEEAEENSGAHTIVPEFLRAQIESNTKVCHSMEEVKASIIETRRNIIEAAGRYGTAVIAASTHPSAEWKRQLPTRKHRYESFALRYQDAIRQLMISGMHVHAGFTHADQRVRVMTRLREYLPLLQALSSSSPYYDGRETGFKSFRLCLYGLLPRTGIPPALNSWEDWRGVVENFQRIEAISDGGELWWDIRPSEKFPTIEMRVCDTCPNIDDAMAICVLYGCLILKFVNEDNPWLPIDHAPAELIQQNRWLAQRYGILAFLGRLREGGKIDVYDQAEELVKELTPYAETKGWMEHLNHVMTIIRFGSSADRQVDQYHLAISQNASHEEAIASVVDLLINETKQQVV